MLKFLPLLLLPFSWLYGGIMAFRNLLYKTGIFKSTAFPLPVISVGNLALGGTGKTPHTEYLVRLLPDKKTAILSRGYGRKTQGFILADQTVTAATIGDEPFQYYQNFNQSGVTVAVCENRVNGITQILNSKPQTEVILLDDAYQHRRVKPSLNLLLTDFRKPFPEDYVLPAGRLREFRVGAKRADAIIVTKCPEKLTDESMATIKTSIRNYSLRNSVRHFDQEYYKKHGKMVRYFSLYKHIRENWKYVHDPRGVDYYATAIETLPVLAGDCDDYAILMASTIMAIGGDARIIITKQHMYAEVKVGTLKDMDEVDEVVRLLFPDESKNKKIHYHATNNELWINFDYTDHYPGSKFQASEVYNVINF